MPHSDEIQMDGGPLKMQLAQRPVLLPLRPRDQQEAALLPERLEQLQRAAAADQHPVIAPTHVMMKGAEIIGYLSLNGLPTVQAWFDSGHKHAADSLKLIEHGETILREQGVRSYAICCAETSPFNPHMNRLGFKLLGTTQVWVKEL